MDASVADPQLAGAPASDLDRRAAALRRWRKRSELVRFYRKALPAAIAAILVFGLGWMLIRAVIAAVSGADRDVGTIHLINPVFYGRNSHNEPYVMAATEAVRDGADPDRIALTNPDLKQYNGNPKPSTVHALHGVYHEDAKLLDLMGHVVFTDGRGYRFRSDFAHVDMPHNSAVGRVHCFIDGPSGTLTADAYQIYDKGEHDIFTGHVFNRLIQASKGAQGPLVVAPAKAPLTPVAVPPMQASVITPAPPMRRPVMNAHLPAGLVLALAASAALALPPPPASAPGASHMAPAPAGAGSGSIGITPTATSNAPVDITAEGVEMFQPQHLTIYKGNVEVVQDTTRMRTPELRVYSRPKGTAPATPPPKSATALDSENTTIDHIDAAGPFYYVTPTQTARSDQMHYEADPNVITLTGNVVLVQGRDVARGDRLVMDRKTGHDQLFSNAPTVASQRVRTILYPQQQQQQPGAKPPAKPSAR